MSFFIALLAPLAQPLWLAAKTRDGGSGEWWLLRPRMGEASLVGGREGEKEEAGRMEMGGASEAAAALLWASREEAEAKSEPVAGRCWDSRSRRKIPPASLSSSSNPYPSSLLRPLLLLPPRPPARPRGAAALPPKPKGSLLEPCGGLVFRLSVLDEPAHLPPT